MKTEKSQQTRRRDTVQAWVNADELAVVQKAAEATGAKSVSSFVREHVLRVSNEINQGRVEPSYQ